MLVSIVLVAHALLTTAGYAGLIGTNAVIVILCRNQAPQTLLDAFVNWRKAHRIFHPILGTGILTGFPLIFMLHETAAATWLLLSYGLVVLGMIANATIMVPWQRNAERMLAQAQAVTVRPVQIVSGVFAVAYTLLLALMLLRPM